MQGLIWRCPIGTGWADWVSGSLLQCNTPIPASDHSDLSPCELSRYTQEEYLTRTPCAEAARPPRAPGYLHHASEQRIGPDASILRKSACAARRGSPSGHHRSRAAQAASERVPPATTPEFVHSGTTRRSIPRFRWKPSEMDFMRSFMSCMVRGTRGIMWLRSIGRIRQCCGISRRSCCRGYWKVCE